MATKLANYLELLWRRIEERLKQWNQELEDKLKTVGSVDEYKRHPGWENLLELVAPGSGHPALVNIDLEKGMVYFSPELWRYIRTRTRSGSLRELDKQLLDKVRDYHGEWAVKLLLTMQMYGGKLSIKEALGEVAGSAVS